MKKSPLAKAGSNLHSLKSVHDSRILQRTVENITNFLLKISAISMMNNNVLNFNLYIFNRIDVIYGQWRQRSMTSSIGFQQTTSLLAKSNSFIRAIRTLLPAFSYKRSAIMQSYTRYAKPFDDIFVGAVSSRRIMSRFGRARRAKLVFN